jgi:hypothetical protein
MLSYTQCYIHRHSVICIVLALCLIPVYILYCIYWIYTVYTRVTHDTRSHSVLSDLTYDSSSSVLTERQRVRVRTPSGEIRQDMRLQSVGGEGGGGGGGGEGGGGDSASFISSSSVLTSATTHTHTHTHIHLLLLNSILSTSTPAQSLFTHTTTSVTTNITVTASATITNWQTIRTTRKGREGIFRDWKENQRIPEISLEHASKCEYKCVYQQQQCCSAGGDSK